MVDGKEMVVADEEVQMLHNPGHLSISLSTASSRSTRAEVLNVQLVVIDQHGEFLCLYKLYASIFYTRIL